MVGLHHVAVAVEIGNVGDLVGRQAMLDGRMPGPLGRRMDRPEMSGEGDLLVVAQRLVAEHDDRVAIDRLFDRVAVGGAERPGEVDAGNLGHEVSRHRLGGDAHNRLLRL